MNGTYEKLAESRHHLYDLGRDMKTAGTSEEKKVDVDGKLAEIDDTFAECVRIPAETYQGKDAASVRAVFSKKAADATGKKPVKVVLADDGWDRTTGYGNDGGHYDHSWLHAYVVVGEGNRGEIWWFTARKDHLNEDRIKFDVYIPEKLAPVALPVATNK